MRRLIQKLCMAVVIVAVFLLDVFYGQTLLSQAKAEDVDQFFAPTDRAQEKTTPAPLWLVIDSSPAMAASIEEVKTRLLRWLATLPDTASIGLVRFEGAGTQVILSPQLLSVQRNLLITSIGGLSVTGVMANSDTLIKALQAIPANASCLSTPVLLITSGQLLASDPLNRLPALPLHLQVISVDHAESASLWRQLLNVDHERADFQQLLSLQEFSDALTRAQAVFAAREAVSVTAAIGLANWPQVIEQSRMFVGLFQPGYRRQWLGNVKRFNLDLRNATSLAPILTTNINELVYDAGAAQALQHFPASRQRRVWTYTGDYKVSASTGWASLPAVGSDANLAAASNELLWTANQNPVHDTRLQQLLQVQDAAQAAEVIAWARGVNVWDQDSQTRRSLGAVVHAVPMVINYGFDAQRYTAPPNNPDDRYESVLVSTQAGWLHAQDAVTQTELFSFMPQELLGDLARLQQQESRTRLATGELSPRYQGLDSSWQQWRYDAWQVDAQGKQFRDQQINAQQGDHIYVLGGMRRGGYNYYGLDVTSAQPQWLGTPSRLAAHLQFVIRGGVFDFVPTSSPYRQMGQAWSEPKLAQVRLQDGVHAVWLFGGGYDAEYYDQPIQLARALEPSVSKSASPKKGSAMYMIDAKSGALLWWAAQQDADTVHADLRHSIVASPKLLDVDGDALVDRIYWVDLGGQVFRQDIDNRLQSPLPALSQRIVLQRFAALGGEQGDNRRFFQPPSVATLSDSSGQARVVIALGSGNSEQPQEVLVQNRVVVLFDDLKLNSAVSTRTFTDLSEIDFTSANGVRLTAQSLGWYWNLGGGANAQGEKVVVAPLIIRNQLMVSSLLPQAGGPENLCHAKRPLSMQRLYVLNALTGAASAALRHYTDLGGSDRFRQYASDGAMPARLQVLWAQEKPIGVVVGTDIYRFGQQLLLPDQPLAITKGWRRLERQVLPLP